MNTQQRSLCLVGLFIMAFLAKAELLTAAVELGTETDDLPVPLMRLIEQKHIDQDFVMWLGDRAQSQADVRAILQDEFGLDRDGELTIPSINVAKALLLRLAPRHQELIQALHDRCHELDRASQLTDEQRDSQAIEAANVYLLSRRSMLTQLIGSDSEFGLFADIVSKRRMKALHHAALSQSADSFERLDGLVDAGIVDLAELNEVELQHQARMLEAIRIASEIESLNRRFKRACQLPDDVTLNCQVEVAESLPIFRYDGRLEKILDTSSMNPDEELDESLLASFKAEEEALFDFLHEESERLLDQVRSELPDSIARRNLLLREIGKSTEFKSTGRIATLLRPMLESDSPESHERMLEHNKESIADTRRTLEVGLKRHQDRGELNATLYRRIRANILNRLVEGELLQFLIDVQLFETESSREFRYSDDELNSDNESLTRCWLTMEVSRKRLRTALNQYLIVRERMFRPIIVPSGPGAGAAVNLSPIVRASSRAEDALAKAQHDWFDAILRLELSRDE